MPYTYDPDEAGIPTEGTHLMTVDTIDETTSSKGDAMWIVRLRTRDGLEAVDFIVHKPNIIDWKFRPLWEAAGLQWPAGRAILDEAQLVDRQVLVTITHERSRDFGLQARIQGYAPAAAGDLSPNGQTTLDEFAQPAAATTTAGDDDDIPF